MPVVIKIADTPALLDGAFKVRYAVFSEQEQLIEPSPNGRIVDRFDAYPSTTNIVAIVDEKVIGSMRVILDSEVGLHADEYYDFADVTPEGISRSSVGHFCLLQEHRSSHIATALMLVTCYHAMSRGVNFVLAPVNPSIAPLLRRVGFKPVDKPFEVPGISGSVLPMTLDTRDLQDVFIEFINNNHRFNFLGSYECHLFGAGERVMQAGDVGDTAYVILDGEMEVLHSTTNKVLATLGPGDIVGELAVFMDDVRIAHVDAKSKVRAMALRKDVFLDHLRSNPDEALNQLKLLGQRMRAMTVQ